MKDALQHYSSPHMIYVWRPSFLNVFGVKAQEKNVKSVASIKAGDRARLRMSFCNLLRSMKKGLVYIAQPLSPTKKRKRFKSYLRL